MAHRGLHGGTCPAPDPRKIAEPPSRLRDAAAFDQPFLYLDDLGAHLARATSSGATIVEPIKHHGFKAYVAEDLEGRRWTFAQARPTMG